MNEMELQGRKSFLTQAGAYLERNELPAVLDLAEARLKRTPGDLDARIAICRVRLLQGRPDEAREMLSEMEDVLASLSRIYADMGDICMKEGMKDSAETFYRKLMFLNPGVPLSRDVTERLNDIGELHATDAEGDAEVPANFHTVTLAELYIRQGHLRPPNHAAWARNLPILSSQRESSATTAASCCADAPLRSRSRTS